MMDDTDHSEQALEKLVVYKNHIKKMFKFDAGLTNLLFTSYLYVLVQLCS